MRLLRAALFAAAVAAVSNVIVYLLFIDRFDFVVPMSGMPITLPAILAFSLVPPFIAAGVLWLADRFTDHPAVWFLAASILVFAAFTVPVFTIGAPAALQAILVLMHFIVAVPTVLLLLRTT